MGILNNRKLAFEISGLKEGRWTIDCIMHEEEEAVSHGRSLLSVGEFEEIRIVRHRTGPTGFTVETEILREKASKDKKRFVGLGGDPDEAPLCKDLNGFYSIEARLSIGKLMRRYLEAENITATELMHVWPYMRRLDDKASQLIGAGVHKVAEAQAKIADVTVRDRVNTLQRFIAKSMERVRDFDYVRRKIPFSLTDLDRSMRRLDAAIGEDNHGFSLVGQICYQLMGINSLSGRLERLLEMVAEAPEGEAREALDGMIADALSFPSIIQDMIATSANRAVAIGRLADVVTGRFAPAPGERVDPILTNFVKLSQEIGLPRSTGIILDWVIREVARDKPFDRHDPKGDEVLLQKLVPRLRDSTGQLLAGVRMQEAIGAHRLAQRQQVLRDMGMHEQANELAKVWTLDMVQKVAPLMARP